MRFAGWNLLLATWLLVSAFALPHSPVSQATTWAAAVAAGAAAIVAVARPAARLAICGIAVLLGVGALLLPGMSTEAAVNDAVIAALLFARSVAGPAAAAPAGSPAP